MEIFPSQSDFINLSKQGNLIPIYADLIADCETPVSAYFKLRQNRPAFLFESVERGENISRYSFIGCKPRKIFKVLPDRTHIITKNSQKSQVIPTPHDPLTLIEAEMRAYHPATLPDMPPFIGGAVGFLSYEYIHRIEPSVPPAPNDELGTPLLYYMITDSVIIFDHVKQTLRICANAHIGPETKPETAYAQAVTEIKAIFSLLCGGPKLKPVPLSKEPAFDIPSGNFTREEFKSLVERSKEYIHAGDIIQVVASQRFTQNFTASPLELYRTLRTINPSPYMFIFETDDYTLVGASPEVHVRLTQDKVEIRPIAGTRPRGQNEREDNALERELLADEKERAEHLMLVDLARNDIGRVCKIGSVHVPEYLAIERYSHVMHIVSQVEGKIAKDKNAYDLMRATFPAGTVSGASKIRAMQIISEFEKTQRGPYAGALGYFSYDGNLDSCITIRTALIKGNTIYIQSGAGLVADSDPEAEYQETLNKAKSMLKAVAMLELP